MQIFNSTRNCLLACEIKFAKNIFSRMRGLLGQSSIRENEALIIESCNSVHSFFMRFTIDVVFVDKDFFVVGMVSDFSPWKISPIYWKAHYAIELPAGKIAATNTQLKDKIEFR